tara:strand:- start:490 stop:1224 length:735 start_codon:yes stop_codon:yes gene_type:complete
MNKKIINSFIKSKYFSIKHMNYFDVYDHLLNKYIGQKFTFVEIGILNGGSLNMWRDYFGQEARIIGIDLNPEVKKFEKDGFEIFVGDQADKQFWNEFFQKVGKVDIILDDGGHTNEQQIVTINECIENINDTGMIIVEDTHASYMKEFNNPSKDSFINFSKNNIDYIHYRFPSIGDKCEPYYSNIFSINFFESIVCYNINRKLCKKNIPVKNTGISSNHKDFRHGDPDKKDKLLDKLKSELDKD